MGGAVCRTIQAQYLQVARYIRTQYVHRPSAASHHRLVHGILRLAGLQDARERMLLHMKGRGQHGGLRVAQTEPKEKKWRHPDAEKVYQGKTEKDKFFFKAEVDLLPRAGLPMWCSRSTREHWR